MTSAKKNGRCGTPRPEVLIKNALTMHEEVVEDEAEVIAVAPGALVEVVEEEDFAHVEHLVGHMSSIPRGSRAVMRQNTRCVALFLDSVVQEEVDQNGVDLSVLVSPEYLLSDELNAPDCATPYLDLP